MADSEDERRDMSESEKEQGEDAGSESEPDETASQRDEGEESRPPSTPGSERSFSDKSEDEHESSADLGDEKAGSEHEAEDNLEDERKRVGNSENEHSEAKEDDNEADFEKCSESSRSSSVSIGAGMPEYPTPAYKGTRNGGFDSNSFGDNSPRGLESGYCQRPGIHGRRQLCLEYSFRWLKKRRWLGWAAIVVSCLAALIAMIFMLMLCFAASILEWLDTK